MFSVLRYQILSLTQVKSLPFTLANYNLSPFSALLTIGDVYGESGEEEKNEDKGVCDNRFLIFGQIICGVWRSQIEKTTAL